MAENAMRLVQLDLVRWTSDAAMAFGSLSGYPQHSSIPREIFADDMVLRVGNDDIPRQVKAEVLGAIERRRPGRAAIPSVSFFPGAGHGSNGAIGCDHPEGVSASFQDVDCSLAIRDHGPRIN